MSMLQIYFPNKFIANAAAALYRLCPKMATVNDSGITARTFTEPLRHPSLRIFGPADNCESSKGLFAQINQVSHALTVLQYAEVRQ